jgi:hypothetical protein
MATKVKPTTFKFTWVPNTAKITKKDRPVNELDKKPGDVDAVSIEKLAEDFLLSPQCEFLRKQLKNKKYKSTRRPQLYSKLPVAAKLKARELLSCLAIQRPLNYKHLIKIILKWDSRRPAAVNILKLVGKEIYYITDGQHTVMAHVIRAALGLFPDYNGDPLDIEVNCLVVEDNDFSFAREHFLGINGGDKLKLAAFDTWKNQVLGKRQDSPTKLTEEEYEIAFEKQQVMERFNVIPVHTESADTEKAGAFIDVNKLANLSPDDLEFICENHNSYWPHDPVSATELLPLRLLKEGCASRGAKIDSAEFKQFMEDLNSIIKTVAGGWDEFASLTKATYKDYYKEAWDEDYNASEPPADASIVLLLKMYKAAGGSYTKIPKNLIDKFSENGSDLFESIDSNLIKIF